MKNEQPVILVTGSNGQLGRELQVLEESHPQYRFIFTDRSTLPVDDTAAIQNFFANNRVQFCINCAAYTAVDKAETNAGQAFAINAKAPGDLAAACLQQGAAFFHISTDYVFDGTASRPYTETDPTCPIGVYGRSKQQGEEAVLANHPRALIIRTSWVYSCFGHNFVKTMLRLMKEKESINVVNDQLGCPTYAADLAQALLTIIGQWNPQALPANRIFNYCNSGIISWYDFADSIRDLTGSACIVSPIPGSLYPTPAKRPAWSALDTKKIRDTFHISIPGWKESLQRCLQLLQTHQ